jgi:hypothetical protein
MAGNTTVTGTADEKDGTVIIKGSDGIDIRYVKESDLLAVKGSRESLEQSAKAADAAREKAIAEGNSKFDAERQKALQAEARISSLEEQIKNGAGTSAEVARLSAELEAAKKSSEVLSTKHLELRRNFITATYGVPKETVLTKDLAALDTFEEALKAVMGDKKLGNFAVGGGGGGASSLQGKKPLDLAVEAYSRNK